MNNNGITLYGAGGHCRVVIDILKANGMNPELVVDDNPSGDSFLGIPMSKPSGRYDRVLITIGNCEIRSRIAEKIKAKEYLTAIHPSSIVCEDVPIGEGTVIAHGAIVQSGASIGRHCILNTKSSIDHDVKVGDFVHIAPGATICGGCEIGEGTWIGAGSVVKQGIHIGKNCMIGAGSVVVRDIPDSVTAFGNPCRPR